MKTSMLIAGLALAASAFMNTAQAEGELQKIETFTGKFDVKVVGTTFNVDETGCDYVNSRTIDLALPKKTRIHKAFLLWSGTGNPDPTIELNGSAVAAINSTQVSFGGFRRTFQAYADVTRIVKKGRRGPFVVSGLDWSRAGMYCSAKSAYGGATLIVVYKSKALPQKTIYVHLGGAGGWKQNHTHQFIIKNISIPRNLCGCCSGCSTCNSCNSCGKVLIILVIWEGDNYKGEHLFINRRPFGDNTLNGSTAPNLDIDRYDITDIVHRGEDTSIYNEVYTYKTGFAYEALVMQGAVTVIEHPETVVAAQ